MNRIKSIISRINRWHLLAALWAFALGIGLSHQPSPIAPMPVNFDAVTTPSEELAFVMPVVTPTAFRVVYRAVQVPANAPPVIIEHDPIDAEKTQVKNLVEGTYVFCATATNDAGLTASRYVTVTVDKPDH